MHDRREAKVAVSWEKLQKRVFLDVSEDVLMSCARTVADGCGHQKQGHAKTFHPQTPKM